MVRKSLRLQLKRENNPFPANFDGKTPAVFTIQGEPDYLELFPEISINEAVVDEWQVPVKSLESFRKRLDSNFAHGSIIKSSSYGTLYHHLVCCNNTPKALIGYTSSLNLELLLNEDINQLANHALLLSLESPSLEQISIILTDGNIFYVGLLTNVLWLGPKITFRPEPIKLYLDNRLIEEHFQIFWNALKFAGLTQNDCIQVGNRKAKIIRCIGMGCSGAVFEARVEGFTENVALKIIHCLATDESEIINELLKHPSSDKDAFLRPLLPVGQVSVNNKAVYYLICPLGLPVSPIVYLPSNLIGNISDKVPFRILLDDLMTIHETGHVHRDIRIENVVLYNDRPRFIDFGSCIHKEARVDYAGSKTTASQRVLSLLLEASANPTDTYNGIPITNFAFTPRDDLESFLKMWLMWKNDHSFEVHFVNRPPQEEDELRRKLLAYWRPRLKHIENMDYAQLADYLINLFK